jgi:hypothetical protein
MIWQAVSCLGSSILLYTSASSIGFEKRRLSLATRPEAERVRVSFIHITFRRWSDSTHPHAGGATRVETQPFATNLKALTNNPVP